MDETAGTKPLPVIGTQDVQTEMNPPSQRTAVKRKRSGERRSRAIKRLVREGRYRDFKALLNSYIMPPLLMSPTAAFRAALVYFPPLATTSVDRSLCLPPENDTISVSAETLKQQYKECMRMYMRGYRANPRSQKAQEASMISEEFTESQPEADRKSVSKESQIIEDQPQKDESQDDFAEFINHRAGVNFDEDFAWAYAHLGIKSVKPTDAPSIPAWELLQYGRENRDQFFRSFLAWSEKRRKDQLGNDAFQDDRRAKFTLLDKLDAALKRDMTSRLENWMERTPEAVIEALAKLGWRCEKITEIVADQSRMDKTKVDDASMKAMRE